MLTWFWLRKKTIIKISIWNIFVHNVNNIKIAGNFICIAEKQLHELQLFCTLSLVVQMIKGIILNAKQQMEAF